MTRKDVLKEVINIPNKTVALELPTSFGKSFIALELIKHKIKPNNSNILIVVPRLVLIDNWKKEIEKWGYTKYNFTFVTYVSLPKHINNIYDIIVYDEAHHLSERCLLSVPFIKSSYNILLSATLGNKLKSSIKTYFKDTYIYKISARQAIEEEILPDPMIYLLPLNLNDIKEDFLIYKNPKGKNVVYCNYKERWSYIKNKNNKVIIRCTASEYYEDLDSMTEFYKNKYMSTGNQAFKNMWLNQAGKRLKWLSEIKINYLLDILHTLKDERTLTFCNNIEQTELLGKYCINSKNTNSEKYLELFNTGKINHITACNMLNEGMNLINCRIGLYANLNSSETIIKQRLGRLLRHKNPILIIPFFLNTREYELVCKMKEDYNPELIKIINNIKEIKL
jgi:superfamily II DNA or RNA helicase